MNPKELLHHLINMSSVMARAALEARRQWYGKVEGKAFEAKLDYASVDALKRYLQSHKLSFKIISEEGFKLGEGKGEYLIVDPVDGTSNMCRGIPFTAVSLAVAKGNLIDDVYIGVVRDIFRDQVFWAIKGIGAYLNNTQIRVSRYRPFNEVFISLSITRAQYPSSKVLKLLPEVRYPRYLGSASLELCYVAAGILDAYVDVRGRLRVFDVAAGQLIVREAGGVVLIKQNGSNQVVIPKVHGISIVAASSKELFDKITAYLEQT